MKETVLCLLLLLGVWWWIQPAPQDLPDSGQRAEGAPLQTSTGRIPWCLGDYLITSLAEFSMKGRVMGKAYYWFGEEAHLSPCDLALGWNRMSDPHVYGPLHISQAARFYAYSWRNQPPIPPEEIVRSSANMHMIPASPAVRAALESVRERDIIQLKGCLVEVTKADGWRWRSSLTREDSGMHSCEVVWVELLEVTGR